MRDSFIPSYVHVSRVLFVKLSHKPQFNQISNLEFLNVQILDVIQLLNFSSRTNLNLEITN